MLQLLALPGPSLPALVCAKATRSAGSIRHTPLALGLASFRLHCCRRFFDCFCSARVCHFSPFPCPESHPASRVQVDPSRRSVTEEKFQQFHSYVFDILRPEGKKYIEKVRPKCPFSCLEVTAPLTMFQVRFL